MTSPPAPKPNPSLPSRFSDSTYSCPACDNGRMWRLEKFYESDVNAKPYTDSVVPNRGFALLFPGLSFLVIIFSTLGDALFGQARVAKGRAKVRKAREEVLPRSPDSLICPRCFEVLERF